MVATIRARGGDVPVTVKDSQPTLAADLALLIADPHTQTTYAQTVVAHRGPRQMRHIRVSAALSAYLAAHSPWPAIAQVAQLTRVVTTKVSTRRETVYLITTLTPAQASLERLLGALAH